MPSITTAKRGERTTPRLCGGALAISICKSRKREESVCQIVEVTAFLSDLA